MTKASKGPCATITPSDKPLEKIPFRAVWRKGKFESCMAFYPLLSFENRQYLSRDGRSPAAGSNKRHNASHRPKDRVQGCCSFWSRIFILCGCSPIEPCFSVCDRGGRQHIRIAGGDAGEPRHGTKAPQGIVSFMDGADCCGRRIYIYYAVRSVGGPKNSRLEMGSASSKICSHCRRYPKRQNFSGTNSVRRRHKHFGAGS
jgi:hypothetical protein